MTWIKIDDQSPFHPKVMSAGNAAWGAFVRLAAYSAAHRLDGFVPMALAIALASTSELERLSSVGLLDPPSGRHKGLEGVSIHDFLVWNPSAKELEAFSKNKKAAGLEGARKRWQSASTTHGTTHSKPNGKTMARARAIPSRPVPSIERESAAPPPAPPAPSPRSTSSPSGARPIGARALDGEDLAHALEAGYDQDEARDMWDRFVSYADGKAWRFTSSGWSKRWRMWVDTERDKPRRPKQHANGHAKKSTPAKLNGDELPIHHAETGDHVRRALETLEGKKKDPS